MKNYLLDTQVFLWMQNEPEKLSKNLNRHLRAKDIRWHLSQITIWEIQVKYDLGKLSLPAAPKDCIPEVIEKQASPINPFKMKRSLCSASFRRSTATPLTDYSPPHQS
jgi:PIN domain nuclease of toxin-antitoxin system